METDKKEIFDKATAFAKQNNLKSVKRLGSWKGFEVFDPIPENDEVAIIGHPRVILVKGGKARFSEPKESYAILAQGL